MPRAKVGDVLEIQTSSGFIYLHFLGKHHEYGACVAVTSSSTAVSAPVSAAIFADAFVTFYPATVAVSRGLARVVGNLPSAGIPKRWRRAGAREGRKVATWIIEEEGTRFLRRELTDEERRLPIVAIWNHEFLLERVRSGWRPEHKG